MLLQGLSANMLATDLAEHLPARLLACHASCCSPRMPISFFLSSLSCRACLPTFWRSTWCTSTVYLVCALDAHTNNNPLFMHVLVLPRRACLPTCWPPT
jgi:hypothetical protein